MRIKNADERRFYEIEATSGNWSFCELQRQYGSSLYNRLLQCYVLVDLKVDKLTHQDLGQMQMYVNYYDRYVKQDFEKPTIGILLCKEKKDTLVKFSCPLPILGILGTLMPDVFLRLMEKCVFAFITQRIWPRQWK